MISEAIKQNPNFIQLRKIEVPLIMPNTYFEQAAREIARVMSKGNNRVFVDSENLLFNIGVNEEDTQH